MPRLFSQGRRHFAHRARGACSILAVCVVLAAGSARLSAQGPESVYYVRARTFYIPFTMPPNDQRSVEVLLNVSVDGGRSYQYVRSARPTDTRFPFTASGDGWYWFTVQTRDRDRVLTPADPRSVPPSMKVCVDTQPPRISLQSVPANDGSPAAIRWKIEDENFDDLRADYHAIGGGDWIPLLLPRTPQGTYPLDSALPGQLEVRLQARDKAGNVDEQRTTLTAGPRRPGAPGPGGPSDIIYVKSTTFQLNYDLDAQTVGPSGVERVDVYMLREGRGWQKYDTRKAQGPFPVKVEGPGRWGFRLVPKSGVGLAERPPGRGDQPQIWVEVDLHVPQVLVRNVQVSQVPDPGKVIVSWSASDAFLKSQPITILYAEKQTGPWQEVTGGRDLPNTGSHTFTPRSGLWQFYVKVTAVDEAGNVGEGLWRDIVKVDLNVPRISKVKVTATEAPPAERQMPPASGTSYPGPSGSAPEKPGPRW